MTSEIMETEPHDCIGVREATRLYREEGCVVGYCTPATAAMLVRLGPRGYREYGFVYVRGKNQKLGPVFIRSTPHACIQAVLYAERNKRNPQRRLFVASDLLEFAQEVDRHFSSQSFFMVYYRPERGGRMRKQRFRADCRETAVREWEGYLSERARENAVLVGVQELPRP